MLNVTNLIGFASGGKAVPTFVNSATRDGSGTLNYPAGASQGDFGFLVIQSGGASISTPSGWTLQSSEVWTTPTTYYTNVFTRTLGAETSVSATTDAFGGSVLLVYRNGGSVGTIGAWNNQAGGTIRLATINPAEPTSMIIGVGVDRDPSALSVTAGWTSRVSFVATYFAFRLAEKYTGTTAATGNSDWSQADLGYAAVGVQIEMKGQ